MRRGRRAKGCRRPLWLLAAGAAAPLLVATPVGAAPAAASLSVTVHGSATGRDGAVMVSYRGTGRVNGTLRGARSGDKVNLVGQTFPFRAGFHQLATARVGTGGAFSFAVAPSLATRYQVRLAGHPATHSKTVTLYVVSRPTGFHYSSSPSCSAPAPTTCRLKLTQTIVLPPMVVSREMAKHRYVYFAVRLRRGNAPAAKPVDLRLDPSARLTMSAKQAPGKYVASVKLAYRVDQDYRSKGWRANWVFEMCSKESFSQDGFGLPYHYGCGATTVPDRAVDLHSLG